MSLARTVLPLLLLLASACQQVARLPTTPPAAPSGTADVSATPATATATPATGGRPTVAPASPRPTAVAGVRAKPLGALTGNWIFAAKQVFDLPQPEVQIWAVPIAGGAAQLAVSYDVPSGGALGAPIDNAPYIRRIFSPDGRRIVVSVNGGLVLIDLTSGSAQALGVTGVFPSWSRDGSRIAFLTPVRRPDSIAPDLEVAVVAVDGGPVRKLGVLDYAHQSVEWSADGSFVLVPQQAGIAVLDVANGRIFRTLDVFGGPAPSFAHWRTGTPQLGVALFGCVDSRSLVALERADAPIRTLVENAERGERCPVVHDPRWNPVADELLYLETPMTGLCCRTHVLDVPSGKDAVLPLEAHQATWSADGGEIVYMTPWHGGPATTYVRVWPRDGRPEREILAANGYEMLVSIASVAY